MLLSFATASATALFCAGAQAPAQLANVTVTALLAAETDAEFINSIPGRYTRELVLEKFPEERYFVEWTERGNAIVMDKRLPALQSNLTVEGGLNALASLDNPSEPFLLTELSAEDRQSVLEQLAVFRPNIREDEDFAVQPRARLEFSVEIDGKRLKGAKGPSVSQETEANGMSICWPICRRPRR